MTESRVALVEHPRRDRGACSRTEGRWRTIARTTRAASPRTFAELVSREMDRMFSVGTLLKIATEATGPSDAIETPGTMR